MKRIYLDYASLTPIDKKVLRFMRKYGGIEYGNPSSIYTSGVNAKKALEEARIRVSQAIGAHRDEIIFTASGTEANNLAFNLPELNNAKKHIIVSAIEHSSVIERAKALEKRGVGVSCINVDEKGLVDLDKLKKEITKDTVLVSIMMVNNEIGTIEPIQEIAKIIRHKRKENDSIYPLFHTDACQATYLPLQMNKLGIDMLTLDSHKVYGPRGVGMLYVKRGIKLETLIHGGGQEKGLRSGTENLPGILGFSFALELAKKMSGKENKRLTELKNYFIEGLKKINPEIKINGDIENSSPHILNILIPNIDNEFFLLKLDANGIECSTRSACLNDENTSYVLNAINAPSKHSLRFSLGRQTKRSDIAHVLKVIGKII